MEAVDMLTDTPYATLDEPVDLATMPIADKVSRFVQARYYQAKLDALQSEARRVGGFFARNAFPAYMPSDVHEHFALAVVVAADAYLSPDDSLSAHVAMAQKRLADGYAHALLRDILAALSALGLHFQIRPEGLDREYLSARRLEWETAASVSERPTERVPYSQTDFVRSFFAKLAEHKHGED